MRYFRYLIATLLLTSFSTQGLSEQETYSFGVVPQFDARRTAEVWKPILDTIHEKTGIRLELETSPSIPEFEKHFNEGHFDFAYMNPYHAVVANANQGYTPFLKDEGRKLYGIIVVKKDSTIKKIEDLNGKTIAFPAPNALGASLIPRSEFAERFNIDINEIYVKSHSSVYLNVVLGHAAAGGGVQKTLSQQPQNIRDSLRILFETEKVAPHPITAHRRIGDRTIKNVQAAFLDMARNEEGNSLLSKIPMKKIGTATMDDYAPLSSMGLEKYYVVQ